VLSKKRFESIRLWGSLGNVLLFQNPAVQVPSTLEGLTVVFEMGTRGSPPPSSPNDCSLVVLTITARKAITLSKLTTSEEEVCEG
jgi:hypothetical protein